jgi:hypothetical protein
MLPRLAGSNFFEGAALGVSQTVNVLDLQGLTVQGWYLTAITSSLAAVRLQVQLNDYTVNYYVAYGPNAGDAYTNTTTRRNILLSQAGCPQTWCLLSRDISADFESIFNSQTSMSVFNAAGPVNVTLAFEVVGFGTMNDNQECFWDDVGAVASIPSQATTTSMTSVSKTTVSTSASISPVPATPSTATVVHTTTRTTTVGSTGSVASEQVYAAIAAVFAIVLAVTAGLMRARMKWAAGQPSEATTKEMKRSRSVKTCGFCGRELAEADRFCDRCGTSQA